MWTSVLLIAVIMVIITDLSGLIPYIKSHLYFRLRGTYDYPDSWDSPIIHLLSCSLCQTWWLGLIYLIVSGNVTLPSIAFLLLVSYLTTTIRDILHFIKDILDRAIDRLYTIIEK